MNLQDLSPEMQQAYKLSTELYKTFAANLPDAELDNEMGRVATIISVATVAFMARVLQGLEYARGKPEGQPIAIIDGIEYLTALDMFIAMLNDGMKFNHLGQQ